MAAKHEKMYKGSPRIEADEHGKKVIKKGPTEAEMKADKVSGGTEKVERGVPAHARHALERRDVHHRHEMEHLMHDHGDGGDKKEMHGRHEKEMSEMHKRHDKELGDSMKKVDTGKKQIDKVEEEE